MRPVLRSATLAAFALVAFSVAARAQSAPSASSPAPTVRDIVYATTDSASRAGHLLDLYLPATSARPVPLVIFSSGSAWLGNNGRDGGRVYAAQLNKLGYAVAGVAIRTSGQTTFPGQLHDIKAAVRWLRKNAAKYNIDPNHIGIAGESSGGWLASMAAVTGDVPELEGNLGATDVSSAVQAAIAYYPPTDFLQMDRWALRPCDPAAGLRPLGAFCHDGAQSPESRLVGCAIQSCAEKVQRANPINYISKADPPIMIIHGQSDALVPHAQGEMFYQALNKACHDAVFISLPVAGHAVWESMMRDPSLVVAATRRSTSSNGCAFENPKPYTPTWATITEFFDKYLK
jgi:acetyl esterase/lipase